MAELYSDEHFPTVQIVGTPMFISIELSSPEPHPTFSCSWSIVDRLEALDQTDELRALRDRAFPYDNGNFISALHQVHERELARAMSRDLYNVRTEAFTLHHPRHDVESLFWDLLWAFLRASPLAGPPAGSHADVSLCAATRTLLPHVIGVDVIRRLLRAHPPVEGLHPLFCKFAPLLQDMGKYLSIPWHLYVDKVTGVQHCHAHVAFQRMLLVEIYHLSANNSPENVALDTQRPRNVISHPFFPDDLEFGPLQVVLGSRSAGSDEVARPLSAPGTSQSGLTRKRSAESHDIEDSDKDGDTLPLRKRLKFTHTATPDDQPIDATTGAITDTVTSHDILPGDRVLCHNHLAAATDDLPPATPSVTPSDDQPDGATAASHAPISGIDGSVDAASGNSGIIA